MPRPSMMQTLPLIGFCSLALASPAKAQLGQSHSPVAAQEATVDLARVVRAKVPWSWLLDDPPQAMLAITPDDLSEADTMLRLASVARQRGYNTDPRFMRLREAMNDAALAELARLNIERGISITDADRQLWFSTHPHRYDQFRLRHIFVGMHGNRIGTDRTETEAASLAREIAARVQRGEKFEALAHRYSDDMTTAAQGGELSILIGAFMAEPFFAAVADAPTGTTTAPVKGEDGFHIIHVDQRIEASVVDAGYYVDQDIMTERLPVAIRQAIAGVPGS